MKRIIPLIGILLCTSYAFQAFSQEPQVIYWRSEASSANWSEGSNQCAEIGTNNSQWWYPHFTPNNSRNAPNCYGTYNLEFGNNHQTIMNNNIEFVHVNRITFAIGASSSRTISGEGIDFRAPSLDAPRINNHSSAAHTLNVVLALHHNPMEINPIDGDLIISGDVYTNNNYIDVYGNNSKTLTLNGIISGGGGLTIKQNSTVIIETNQTYAGLTTLDAGVLELKASLSSSAVTVKSGAKLLINGNAVEVASLTIESGGLVEIAPGKSLTVTGALANSAGNSGLVIKSDATGTGSLIHSTAGVNARVERYLSGSSEAWHLLSSPVTGQAISGEWTPSGTYPDGSGYDIYVYDEASNTYVNRKNTIANPIGDDELRFDDESVNGSLNFVAGKGYMVAFEAVGSVKSFTGTLNEGTIYMPLLSKVGTSIYAGSNLVGNPYPSSIDWKGQGVDFTGVRTETGGGKQFYIWNQTANNFGVYNSENAGDGGTNGASRYIAPMQGFWVVAAINGGELGFDNDARVHSSQAWLKASTATNPSLVIRATAPELIGYDEIILEYGHESSIGGASKKFSFVTTAPSLYMEKGTEQFSIRYLTDVTSNSEIPVAFKPGTNGIYTLSVPSGLEAFEHVKLHDLAIGITQDIKQYPDYTFTAAEGDNPNRFLLKFSAVGIDEANTANSISAWVYNNILYLNNQQEPAMVEVFDTMGRNLFTKQINGTGLQSMNLSLPSGVYLIRVSNSGTITTIKAAIQ